MSVVCSLPSWALLESEVRLDVKDREPGWVMLEVARSKSVGCADDDHFDKVVQGFRLMVRLACPPAVSYLGICSLEPIHYAQILVADQDHIIISICFDRSDAYYLIYKATDGSLTMTPHSDVSNPDYQGWGLVPLPLPIRQRDGRYTLVELASSKAVQPGQICCLDVLCLWPPSPLPSVSSSKPSCSKTLHWQIEQVDFPKLMPAPLDVGFSVERTFSFKGMACWVDLARGVLYCKHSDIANHGKPVQFQFIDLPEGCRFDPHVTRDVSAGTFRTMGCVGDSIKFVSISGYRSTDMDEPANCKVTIWTLMPDLKTWKKDGRPPLIRQLWQQPMFRMAGLSTSVRPTMPMLSPHEDGILYMVLPDYTVGVGGVLSCRNQHILRVDMRKMQLLSSKQLPDSDHFFMLRILGFDFYKFATCFSDEVIFDVPNKPLTSPGKTSKPKPWK